MIISRLGNWPGMDWWSPYGELERMKQDMDRLTQGMLLRGFQRPRLAGVFPLVNLTEDKDNFFLRAELPGILPENLDISATSNSITISGERRILDESDSTKYHRREREGGRFSRVVSLPDQVDPEKIDANCSNGVLTVTIPKAEKSKPRQISIKAS
ncbi:MAG: Hsp20/alpha crystallin family protein [Thermodesulfobacteriota bacterium]